ncbi:DUF3795 domain-containing protein [candidate division WOR-3 bacterium]|nr:DUF3795 domain-containing protein [candidate division WOR-3 bacterium]
MMKENKNSIAYCGLYCGECFNYKGEIADLARDLRKKLREEKISKAALELSKFFKPLKNYDTCYEVLGVMVRFRCRKTCKGGGGPPFCKIRKCCQKKGVEGCWECEEFEICKKLDFLKPIHGEAHIKNLRKLKKQGVDKFLEGKKYW